MNPAAIHAFAVRDWEALERSKRDHWARELRERGPSAAIEACWTLWQHVRSLRSDWPDEAQRADDIAHHLELAGKLAVAARVIAAR